MADQPDIIRVIVPAEPEVVRVLVPGQPGPRGPAGPGSYNNAAALQAAIPTGNFVWVGGFMWSRRAEGQATDESLIVAGDGSEWLYGEVEVWGEALGVAPYDNVTDSAPALMKAQRVALAQKKVLRIGLQSTGISQPVRNEDLPFMSAVRIHGSGTRVYLNTGFSGQRPHLVGGTQVVGSLQVVWNNLGGNDPPVTRRPVCTLAEDAERNAYTFKPLMPAGVSLGDALKPGYMIGLQTQKLSPGEHRNYMVCGETTMIRDVDLNTGVVEVTTPFQQAYSYADSLHATTVAALPAPTTRAVTFATAPPQDVVDQIIGMQMTVGGVSRYISTYDPVSRVAAFYTGGEWDQLAWATPAVNAPITVNAKTYVMVFLPIELHISGLVFDHSNINTNSGTGQNGWRGPMYSFLSNPVVENFGVYGAPKMGLYLETAFNPLVRQSWVDRSNDAELGYGFEFGQSRDVTLTDWWTKNCRRSTDTTGQYQSWNGDVYDWRAGGGWKTLQGTPWEGADDAEQNYGVGGHGQMANWRFYDGRVTGMKIGALDRGTLNSFFNIRGDNMMEVGVYKGAGGDLIVRDIDLDWLYRKENAGPSLNVGGDNKCMCRVLISDRYPLEPTFAANVQNPTVRGFTVLLDILVNAAYENTTWSNWVVKGASGMLRTAADTYLIRINRQLITDAWTCYPNPLITEGQPADKRTQFSTGLRLVNTFMRVGDTAFAVSIDDDRVVSFKLPFVLGAENLLLELYSRNIAGDDVYGRGTVTEASNGPGGAHGFTRDLSAGTGTQNVRQYAGPLTGTTGADGFVNIAYRDQRGFLDIENRRGGTRSMMLLLNQAG